MPMILVKPTKVAKRLAGNQLAASFKQETKENAAPAPTSIRVILAVTGESDKENNRQPVPAMANGRRGPNRSGYPSGIRP